LWDDDNSGAVGLKEFNLALTIGLKNHVGHGADFKSAKEMQNMVRTTTRIRPPVRLSPHAPTAVCCALHTSMALGATACSPFGSSMIG
jgi:hypothetical protein